jgi:amino acid transporter
MVDWLMPIVLPEGLALREPQDGGALSYTVIAVLISLGLWGAVHEGPILRHFQWFIGVSCFFSAYLVTDFAIGMRTDPYYVECTFSNCWPAGYQEWVLGIPILATSLALFVMGTIGLRFSAFTRRIVPISVFVVLYVVLLLAWRPVGLPYFGSPPPAWSF